MNGTHSFSVRVYYEDTDFSGNVYHAAYLKFMERGRTEFLRTKGVHHHELARNGMAFAVRAMTIEFEAAGHIDDMLDIETGIVKVHGARLMLHQTIRLAGKALVDARIVIVAIKDGRAARLPRAVVALGND